MFGWKKARDGEREKETERGNKTSVPSPASLRGGVRPASGREETQTPPPEAQCPSEIRLVLLGRKGAGKSSAGNTILGIKDGGFTCGSPTEVCMERWADVAGRRVVIVDTPGWEWYYPLNGTPDWVKWETVRSVTLSPPGPHALLLVVRGCASMDGMYLKAIQEHMELLGEGVWKHTLVLFTQDDNPDDSTIEGRIRKGGADFQLLVEKCGNRWHILNSKARGRDTTQVVELLRKVEQMVAANGGAPLEMEQVHQCLEQEDRGWRPREERRNQRLLEVRKLGESLQEIFAGDGSLVTWREEVEARWPPGRGRRLPDLRVVLLGERETGKTLAGNTILGGVSFQAGRVTEECVSAQGEVAGRWVTVVDTPGWECKRTPERVRHEIRRSVTLCPPGPHALLLVIGVDSDITVQAATEHLGLLGEEAWRYALVLFTGEDKLRRGVTIEQHVQSSGKASRLVERCKGRYHVISGMEPGNTAQVTRLLEKVEDLVAGNGGQPFTPLTQEIRELVRRKDERCKDVTEMKRKSRWSFERKPKERDKMEGKPEMGREEEEERRQTEMRKLLDKRLKMEIQEVKEKNDRIVAILDQEYKLREGDIKVENELKIEEKEMEIKALKEKNKEIEIKILTVEREINQERQKWEEERENMHQNSTKEREELEKRIEEEKFELMERTAATEKEMGEFRGLSQRLAKTEEELRKIIQNKNTEIVELNKLNQEKTKEFEDLVMKFSKSLEDMDNLKEKSKEKDSVLEKMKESCEEQKKKREAEIKEKIQKHDLETEELKHRNATKEREFCNLQQMYKEKEREVEELQHRLQEREQHTEVLKQDFEKQQQQREQVWRVENEKMKNQMKETTEMYEKKRKGREQEIGELRKNYEEKMREINTKNEGKLREQEKEIRNIEGVLREKDKKMEDIKQHYEEELRKTQLEMKLKDEEKEREEERSRQILTEREAQLELNDQRISELMDQAQENEKRTKVTEKRLKDELMKKAEELEEKMKEKEKEVEEMRERCEHSESQRAKLEVMIEQLKTESAELVERIHITVKERDEIKEQHGKKELQMEEDVMGVVREKDKELKDMKMEMNELQRKHDEKEREIDKMRHIVEEKEEKISASLQKYEEEQTQREEEWKGKYEKMQEEMEEIKQMDEEKRKVRETEIDSVLEEKEKMINELKQKYEESKRNLVCLEESYENFSLERDGKIEEMKKRCEDYRKEKEEQRKRAEKTEMEMNDMQKRYIEEMKERNEKKDKEMEIIKEHYEEELSKIQLEMKLKDEEKEREEERSRQILTEREAQLELNDQRISELMDQAQENEKRAKVTEKRLKDELMKKAEELEEKMKEKEKEVEEMRERCEHSESQRAKLEVMIEQLKTESAELVERIHITVKERDEIKEQHGKKELQMEEDVMGMVREKDKELKDMKMEINELQKKNDEKEREIDKLGHIIEERKKEITASLQKYEEDEKQREEEWKEKYEKMQEEMEEIKQMDEQKRRVREEMDSVLEEKEKLINELKQKNEESERNLVCLREEYETLKINQIYEEKLKVMETDMEVKERHLNELKQKYDGSEKRLVSITEEYEDAQKQIEKLEGLISLREAELRETKERCEEYKKELEELQGAISQKKREVDQNNLNYLEELKNKEGVITRIDGVDNESARRNRQLLEERARQRDAEIKQIPKPKELQLRYMGKERKMADMEKMHNNAKKGAEEFCTMYQEVGVDIREREEDNKEDANHYVKEEEIPQIQTEMNKVVRHKNKHSITTIHEEEENKVKASQGNTTVLHIKAGETEEGVAGVVKEKQEIREDDSDPSEREGQGEVIKQKNEEQEKEVDKPKWKEERHRAKEGSKGKNLNHCGDNERVNDLLPTEEMRERRISKRERKDAQKERRTQNAVTGQRAGSKERSFQKQAKEIRGSGELRKETELNVPKPFQSLSPNKPAGVIAEGSPEQPPSTVSPTFPLSPGSPSQVYTAFPSFPEYPGLSELRLVLLGESWASNSSAGNRILGEMEAVTEEGAVRRGQAAGRRVSLVEVTGSRWHLGGEAAGDALREAAQRSPGPHAFLLVIPAYLSFTASYGRAVRRHMAALGERAWRHTLVLFTWAEALGESVEQHVLRSEGLRRLVHRCGNRYHTLHSWRNAGQVSRLLEKVEEMVAENRGGFYCWGASEEEEDKDEEEAELEEEEEEEAEGRVELENLIEADRTAGERKEWSETKWQETKSNGEEETRETNEYRVVERLDEFSDSSIERVHEMEEKMRDQEEDQVLFCNPPTEPQTPVQNHRPPCSLV